MMKLFVTLAYLVLTITASDEDLWAKFKNDHGKTYKSLREEKLRFNIFQEKLREIEWHNAKYENEEVSYFLRVNQFSDMTSEEFSAMLRRSIAGHPRLHDNPLRHKVNASATIPESINWKEKGAVLRVKDQGHCGSCWAFSATGAVEGQNIIKNGKKVALSEQHMIDCSKDNSGCYGGYIEASMDFFKQTGVATEESYPYKGVKGTCQSVKDVVKITEFVYVDENEGALQNAVATIGPIAVNVNSDSWQSYGGGIFENDLCFPTLLDHAALVVGYGVENSQEYWLIKNSWGLGWGEDGYMRLARNKDNQCGVSSYPTYPIL